MSTTKSLSKNLLALTVGLSVVSGAVAQSDKKPRRAAEVMLEEVMVVARKLSAAENVQDVPLAISAYGAEQLDAMYMGDLTDLSFRVPSVQTDQSGTFPGVQNFTIRGQGINSSIPSVDPTVGIFVDGVYMGTTYGVVLDTFDLESIEILRGPQGLLFGRNVTGGAVVLRTARPTGEFGLKTRVRASTGLETNIDFSIENGLTDNLAGKLSVHYMDDEGYWKNTTDTAVTGSGHPFITSVSDEARPNPASGDRAGEAENQTVRGTLVWDATPELAFTLIGETGDSEGDGGVFRSRESLESGVLAADEVSMDNEGIMDMTWNSLTLETTWELGGGVLTNILAHRDIDVEASTDIDGSALALFTGNAQTSQEQFSNELRYAFSSDDGRWDVTTGLYYFEQDISYREQRWIGAGLILLTPLPALNLISLGGDLDHDTWGLFGSADYKLTDNVVLTAGLRYTEEDKTSIVVNADPSAGGVSCNSGRDYSSCQFDELADDWSNISPKVGINWRVGEALDFYASYTRGIRSGGVNFRNALPSIIDPGPTDEEEQDAYEIGMKSQWLDGRVRLNGAIYRVDVADMQRELNVGTELPLVLASGLLVWQATINVGDAEINGAEMELQSLIGENLVLTATLGYVDSEYKQLSTAVLSAQALLPPGFQLIGDDLPRLAPWSGSLGLSYDLDLDDLGLVTFRANYSFRDAAPYNDSNTQILRQINMADASVQWSSASGHWTASLFGKNLNNEVQFGSLAALPTGTNGGVSKGRVYGLEVGYSY